MGNRTSGRGSVAPLLANLFAEDDRVRWGKNELVVEMVEKQDYERQRYGVEEDHCGADDQADRIGEESCETDGFPG